MKNQTILGLDMEILASMLFFYIFPSIGFLIKGEFNCKAYVIWFIITSFVILLKLNRRLIKEDVI